MGIFTLQQPQINWITAHLEVSIVALPCDSVVKGIG